MTSNTIHHKLKLKTIFFILLSLLIVGAGICVVLNRYAPFQRSDNSSGGAYRVQPDDLTGIIRSADIIVEGVVSKVHASQWPETDKAPENASQARELRSRGIDLRTPIELSVKRVLKGENVSNTLLFTTLGGYSPESGEGQIDYGDLANRQIEMLKEGNNVIVLLSYAPDNAGPWAQISPLYLQIVFIIEGDYLIGPAKQISQSTFTRQLEGSK